MRNIAYYLLVLKNLNNSHSLEVMNYSTSPGISMIFTQINFVTWHKQEKIKWVKINRRKYLMYICISGVNTHHSQSIMGYDAWSYLRDLTKY